MELFHSIRPAFEKTAGRYPISKDRDMMFSEIMGFLYKEAPYLAEYTVSLDIKGQDETSGYIYGSMKISPKTLVGPAMSQNGLVRTFTEPANKIAISIPVIVDNSKLFPFDVFIDSQGKFQPLTSRRVKIALQEPSPYAVARLPTEAGGYGDAFSDMQSAPTAAHGQMAMGPNAEVKTASILSRVAGGLSKEACDKYLRAAESDRWVRSQIEDNPGLSAALGLLVKTASTEKAPMWDEEVIAAVLEKTSGGFNVTAVVDGPYVCKTASLTNAEAASLPARFRNEAVKTGFALLTSDNNEGISKTKDTPTLEEISQSGIYAVVEKSGKIKKAAVIADVRTLDGRKTSLKFAVSPSGGCTQEKIAGVWTGDLINFEKLAGQDPSGDVFMLVDEAVYGPVTIHNRVTDIDGVSRYAYSTSLGSSGLLKTASVLRPSALGDGNYLIPTSTRFLPVDWRGGLLSDSTRIEKIASKKDLIAEVRIIKDGSRFTFSGGSGISKLAQDQHTELKTPQALLLLGSLGSTSNQAKKTLAEVYKLGEARILPSRSLSLVPFEVEKVAFDRTALTIINGLRADLLKEAAALTDSKTVDSVLSLNFVSPENIQEYLGSRPQLGESLSSLCEMLVAARLGMSDVPENALTSCITSLDKILQGLDALEIRSRHMMTHPQL